MTAPSNRGRIRDSRIVVALAILVLLVSRPMWPEDAVHESVEYVGYALVILCVFGRIWSAVYIGGWKTTRLLTTGPFSVVRNPLYASSFLGVLGAGLFTESAVFTFIFTLAFAIYYARVVRREETNLAEKFGPAFDAYRATVPRWLPKFALYRSPESIEVKPRFVLNVMRDAIWFFMIFPLIELIEFLHDVDWLPTLFVLP